MLLESVSESDQAVLDVATELFQNLLEQAKEQKASPNLVAVISLLEKKVLRLAKQELRSRQYTFDALLEEKNFYEKETLRLSERNEELEKKAKRCQLELELCKLDLPEALLESRNEIDSLREDSKKVIELEKKNDIFHAELKQLDRDYNGLLRENAKLKDTCELLKEELEQTNENLQNLEEEIEEKNAQLAEIMDQCDRLYAEKNIAIVTRNELVRQNGQYKEELINMKTNVINLRAANESLQARMKVEKVKQQNNSKLLDDIADLLYCRCETQFGDSLPILGSCGHTICRNCFEELARTDCPHCGETKAFKQGIVNALILTIIRVLERPHSPSVVDSPQRESPTIDSRDPTEINRPLMKTKKRASILNLFRNNTQNENK